MMELRPIQAALLAGRSASRRATTNPSILSHPLAPSFYRCFSSTRPSYSEAEATAPPPAPSMQEWSRQQQERQQQQQQQTQSGKPQQPAWGSAANSLGSTTGGIASLLTPNPPAASSQPAAPPMTTTSPQRSLRAPWAAPTSLGLRRAQEKRIAASGDRNGKTPGILDDLEKDLRLTTEDLYRDYQSLQPESVSEIKYRLRPSIGRTVPIDSKVDLARGLGLLNLRVRINKVSQDVSRQRFHERPGLKRKRLRRERWRARFKAGFKATCKRVQDLARQGW